MQVNRIIPPELVTVITDLLEQLNTAIQFVEIDDMPDGGQIDDMRSAVVKATAVLHPGTLLVMVHCGCGQTFGPVKDPEYLSKPCPACKSIQSATVTFLNHNNTPEQ